MVSEIFCMIYLNLKKFVLGFFHFYFWDTVTE